MHNSPSISAESLLDQLHSAILSADFSTLSALSPQLEQALIMAQTLRDEAALRRLNAKATRNAACLLAAGRGVRSAQNRMTELRNISAGSQTYNDRGQRSDLGANPRLMGRF